MANGRNRLDKIQDSAKQEVKSFNEGEKSEQELLDELLAYKSGNDSALKEEKREQERKDNDHKWREFQKGIEAKGLGFLTIIAIMGMIATGTVWFIQFLMPNEWLVDFFPLEKEKIERIERFLFGAVTSGFVSARYFATRKK